MANPDHLAVLAQGVKAWNKWRSNHDDRPDLSHADLKGKNLSFANLDEARLTGANLILADLSNSMLSEANLYQADLTGAHLDMVHLIRANLARANLTGASLGGALLFNANLTNANFTRANLARANLTGALLLSTEFTHATLTGCIVHGVSAWGVRLEGAQQADLVITLPPEPAITVDNLELAQFIYLLLNNPKIREIIDTIGNKAVLIIGRFTPKRKAVLDSLRGELRRRDYVPIVFDFDPPTSRDLTETISTLAHLARFVIADLTDAKSVPQELQRIVPNLPSVPIQPILLASHDEYALFEHFSRYPWVLETFVYESEQQLLSEIAQAVIEPAEGKVIELRR